VQVQSTRELRAKQVRIRRRRQRSHKQQRLFPKPRRRGGRKEVIAPTGSDGVLNTVGDAAASRERLREGENAP